MKKWVMGAVALLLLAVGIMVARSGAVVGRGYVIVGGETVAVTDQEKLARVAASIQQAGGVGATVLWVTPGVDVREQYAGSIPSKDKPIVAISGCRQPTKLLGLIWLLKVEMDSTWVEQVWGSSEVDKRINGLMLNCLIYGMSRGEETTYKNAVAGAVEAMEGVTMFGRGTGGAE